MTHEFWGQVAEDWAGFSGEVLFAYPFFQHAVPVFLGEEDSEDDEVPPTDAELAEFAATYQAFIRVVEERLQALQNQAFGYYQRCYAGFYENSERSGESPLGLDTVKKHSQYLKNLQYVRVTAGGTLRLSISYGLDKEHGLEVKFVNGTIERVGGIADT